MTETIKNNDDKQEAKVVKNKKSRPEMRFDREAKALQKNLDKRKKQQQARDDAKK